MIKNYPKIIFIYLRKKKKYKYSNILNTIKRFETEHGLFFLPNSVHDRDDAIAKAIKTGKIFDEEVLDWIFRGYRPNTSVLDVGSNFGQMAIILGSKLMAELAKSDNRIFAFEAEPTVESILQSNITSNNLNKFVKVVPNPVWNEVGHRVEFPEPDLLTNPTYGSHGISRPGTNGRNFVTTTIDHEIINLSNIEVSVVKIDIQGADLKAMQGMIRIIVRDKPLIIFEYEEEMSRNLGDNFQDYLDFISSIQYKFLSNFGSNFVICHYSNYDDFILESK
jgi:FkbM family methyltransferase